MRLRMRYEYKVVPAPARGIKAKGVKAPEARFALGVEQILNEMSAQGWEYQRADLLPSEERAGLTGTATNWRNLLVFRRAVAAAEEAGTAEEAAPVAALPARREPSVAVPVAPPAEDAPPPSFAPRRRPPRLTAEAEEEDGPDEADAEGLTGIERAMRQRGSTGPD